MPEILPLHARAKGTAIGISSNWLWNFVIVMITPTIIDKLQWKAYLIFMCTNLAFIPLVYFCYPETANLTLEEIDFLFTNPEKGAVKLSIELNKERKRGVRGESFVRTSVGRRASAAGSGKSNDGGAVEQHEKV